MTLLLASRTLMEAPARGEGEPFSRAQKLRAPTGGPRTTAQRAG